MKEPAVEIRVRLEHIADPLYVARNVVAEALIRSSCRVERYMTLLLVTELTANAVRHGGGVVTLVARAGETTARVEVHDADPNLPIVRKVDPLEEAGRGMWLVDQLASDWGYSVVPDNGKAVWFELHAD